MNTTSEHNARIEKMSFTAVYLMYLARVGLNKNESQKLLTWLFEHVKTIT